MKIETNNKSGLMCINNEVDLSMTAEEMFNKLGYKKLKEEKNYLRYNDFNDYHFGNCIDFDLKNKKVRATNVTCQGNRHFRYMSVDEIKAINKQIEELGWK